MREGALTQDVTVSGLQLQSCSGVGCARRCHGNILYERKFTWVIWACWNALLLVYLTALLILLLFPLCLRVFGHTVDYLKNQVFITQRGIAS